MIPTRALTRPAFRPWSSYHPALATGVRDLHRIPKRTPLLTPKLGIAPRRRDGVAWQSSVTGEGKSGHIVAGPNESILYFDSMITPRPILTSFNVG